MALPCFDEDMTVGVWDQLRYNILFLEWKFYVKILTTTEVIQKNVSGGGGGGGF